MDAVRQDVSFHFQTSRQPRPTSCFIFTTHTHTHTRKRSMFSSNSRRESEWADFPECHIYFFPRHILEVLTFPASHTEHIPVGTVWTLCSWAACFSHGRSVAWWSHSPSWKGCGDERWSGWRCLVHSLKEWQNEKKGGKQGCYSCHVQLIQVFHLVRVFRMKKRGRPNELFKKKQLIPFTFWDCSEILPRSAAPNFSHLQKSPLHRHAL